MKTSIAIKDSHRIINAGSLILVCSSFENRSTISTIAWHMPVSASPKLVAIALAHNRFTLELLEQSQAFSINVPTMDLLEAVKYCGSKSGRDVNKFKETGLTPVLCQEIQGNYIDECIANIECSLYNIHDAGDHKIVVGKVEAAHTESGFLTKENVIDLDRTKLIQHLGGKHFATLCKPFS